MLHAIHRVTGFTVVGPYTLSVAFADGTQQSINFEPVLHGALFGPLRDLATFDGVTLDTVGTLVWPNGACRAGMRTNTAIVGILARRGGEAEATSRHDARDVRHHRSHHPLASGAGLLQVHDLRLPDYHLERSDNDLVLEFTGRWAEVTYWETIALSIVNEVYYRALLRRLTRFEREAIFAVGIGRLRQKIATLRAHPDIVFSDFGTRRRFSGPWQHYVDEVLRDELNGGSFEGRFLGTSNTYSAMTAGLVPMGTAAHELPMIIAGMLDTGDTDPAWLRRAQRQVIDDWWEQYGWGLSIFLPDTFGTDFFFTVVSDDDLRRWKGFRWDSGDLFGFGERVIRAYAAIDVDPREKMLVPSDALDLPLILDAQKRFAGRIRVSYGWGTGLTNDLLDNVMIDDAWYGPVSLVVKPVRANGRGLVKLSDNPAKAIGEPGDVERYKRAAGYGEHELVALKY
jgi:nicotinate phosphoribosyltransferase